MRNTNTYPTAISAASRCLAERREPSVAVQNTYSSLKGMETQDTTQEIANFVSMSTGDCTVNDKISFEVAILK